MKSLDVYFDISSPWTYLAFENLLKMQAELGFAIAWKPILVGGIFNSINPSVYQSRETPVPAKAAYMKKDLADWARATGIKILWPPTVFPVNSVKAMRGCISHVGQGTMVDFARAAFKAYWSDDLDISQDTVLSDLCEQVGVDPGGFFAAIADPAIKDQLKANTEQAMARGAFGSPTIFLGDDMYFGNDRLPLVRAALTGAFANP
jgi:2-hydroxychromene-2-carboxylate isomerase